MRAVSSTSAVTQVHMISRTGLGWQRRWNSSQTRQNAGKPISPHVGFYKTFGRPIAKVLLMATFTYQLAYWAWVKLEKDEIKAKKTGEIDELEKKLGDLTKGKDKPSPP